MQNCGFSNQIKDFYPILQLVEKKKSDRETLDYIGLFQIFINFYRNIYNVT